MIDRYQAALSWIVLYTKSRRARPVYGTWHDLVAKREIDVLLGFYSIFLKIPDYCNLLDYERADCCNKLDYESEISLTRISRLTN